MNNALGETLCPVIPSVFTVNLASPQQSEGTGSQQLQI